MHYAVLQTQPVQCEEQLHVYTSTGAKVTWHRGNMASIECQTIVTYLCILFSWISDFKTPVRTVRQISSFVCCNECSLPLYWGLCLIFISIRCNRSVSLHSSIAELLLKGSKTPQCNENYAWLMTSRWRQCVSWTDKLKQWECTKCRVAAHQAVSQCCRSMSFDFTLFLAWITKCIFSRRGNSLSLKALVPTG